MAQTVDGRDTTGVGSPLPSVLEVDETAERDHPREAVSSHVGSRWRYQQGCRCADCTTANREYAAKMRRRRARPDRLQLAALLPPGRVRSHIQDLLDAGMSRREISRQALISDAVIRNILDGQPRVHPAVAAKILDVLPERAIRHDVPGAPAPVLDPLHVLRILASPDELTWRARGECRRLDLDVEERKRVWFPGQGGDTDQGKRVCNGGRPLGGGLVAEPCPVKGECLAFALDHDEHGIWGGTNYAEREAMRAE